VELVRIGAFVLVGGLDVVSGQAVTQTALASESKLRPDLQDIDYGPHERNVLDVWRAKSENPTPPIVFLQGGGASTFLLSPLRNRGIECVIRPRDD
jgi:hypothetical protein